MKPIFQFFIITLMAAGLSACSLGTDALPTPNEEGLIFVTATAPLPTPNEEGIIVITATPNPVTEPTATASFTPEPTPEPDELLSEAQTALLQGYLETAIADYRAVLQQGDAAGADLRAEAAFRLGQAAVREGLFGDALEALTLFINEFPGDGRLPQAYFLRGDANLGLSQWNEAAADFQQYLTLRPGLIDSYAYERLADARLALGQLEEALTAYDSAIAAQRTLVPQLILREKVAQILANAGRPDAAVAQYDAILDVARNAPYRASIELLAAQVQLDAGNLEVGLRRAQRIVDTYPQTVSAYPAVEILVENDVNIDGLKRGRAAYVRGDYQDAIDAFNDYSSNFQLDAIPADMYLLLGRAYREIGNPQAALVAFQTVIDQFPGDPAFGEALLEQGRTRFLSGDIPAAIDTYLRVADTYGYLADTAAEALWRAGYLYGTNGDPGQSRAIFLRMADEYPDDEWTLNGLFLAASAAVTSEEWAIAENLYGRIAALAQGEDQAAAYLWVGRLAQQRSDPNAAEQAFSLAEAAAPDSFFGARAGDLRINRAAFQPPAQVRFEFDVAAEQASAEDWLRSTFGIEQTGSLAALSETLRSDPRFVRASELWAVAAYDEAEDEFNALLEEARTAGDALSSYQLALELRDKGAYLSSIVAAADVINAAGVGTLDAPAFIARLRYPAYYVELVQAQAQQYGFDPLLMLSLIRQESLFNAQARSVANAIGLTQVIPTTGQYIAGELGHPNFQPSDLTRPYLSVAFGAFYLDEQLRLFDGNAAAALAAYNAGPGRALDWYRLSGGEIDLFVTTITLDEPRRYVQRIYSHYNIYRALYSA